ncbi:MAG TPA: succinylglutamate desuccinylase/aspartoacylase family protein [Thermoanaerobaculia bacterium]
MKHGIVVCLVSFVATGLFARDPLSVGSVAANPGQKVSGWIDVPRGSDEGTKIPVSVAHGAKSGPVLALIAGTHGYEYRSIIALQRVLAALDPALMSGSVILVQMANPTTFYGRRVYYGADGKNLNRMYPGDPKGRSASGSRTRSRPR